jgi:hypothetical protein
MKSDDNIIKNICRKYWDGISTADPVYEYLAKSAAILSSEPY